MTKEQALSLFGITAIPEERELLKIYREKMKKAHPDAGGSDALATAVNEAYDILLNDKNEEPEFNLEQYKKEQEAFFNDLTKHTVSQKATVAFEDYYRYIHGETIEVLSRGTKVPIRVDCYHNYDLAIEFAIPIHIREQEEPEKEVIAYGYGQVEPGGLINCLVKVETSNKKPVTLRVHLLDKKLEVTTTGNSVVFGFKLPKCVVNVRVVREISLEQEA